MANYLISSDRGGMQIAPDRLAAVGQGSRPVAPTGVGAGVGAFTIVRVAARICRGRHEVRPIGRGPRSDRTMRARRTSS